MQRIRVYNNEEDFEYESGYELTLKYKPTIYTMLSSIFSDSRDYMRMLIFKDNVAIPMSEYSNPLLSGKYEIHVSHTEKIYVVV
jgi:hypothetical protein